MIIELEKEDKQQTELFINFFEKFDYSFPDPFSGHVVIKDYCTKLLSNGKCFIQIENEQIEGFVCAYMNDLESKCAFLQVLLVNPNHRGKGIGKDLTMHMHNVAKENGMLKCQVTVDKNNTNAIALYKSVGYIESSIEHNNSQKQYMLKNLIRENND